MLINKKLTIFLCLKQFDFFNSTYLFLSNSQIIWLKNSNFLIVISIRKLKLVS